MHRKLEKVVKINDFSTMKVDQSSYFSERNEIQEAENNNPYVDEYYDDTVQDKG